MNNATQKPQETQQDFFGDYQGKPERTERIPGISRHQKPILLSTSVEQLIFWAIMAVLVLSLAFFLGILRGKAIARLQAPPVATIAPLRAPATVTVPVAVTAVNRTGDLTVARTAPSQNAKPAPKEKPYTIQLASFKKKEWADAEVSALRRMGYTAAPLKAGEQYIVTVGQYASSQDAQKDYRSLKTRYKDSFLRRR